MVTLGHILTQGCELVNIYDSTSDICMNTCHRMSDTKCLNIYV
jgi:hypothetical protein